MTNFNKLDDQFGQYIEHASGIDYRKRNIFLTILI